jgi:preprotein translocase subunit SecE
VAIQIYKSGQGRYVRVGTAIGMALVVLMLAYYAMVVMGRHLPTAETWSVYVQFGVPALLAVALVLVAAWLLNKPSFVDFLIATESEMKKVSWSSRAELLGSTAVVIVTVFLMAFIIWLVDMGFLAFLTKVLHLW